MGTIEDISTVKGEKNGSSGKGRYQMVCLRASLRKGFVVVNLI